MKKTKDEILDEVAKEYKQESFYYALKNCLPSYLHEIVHHAMQEYADQSPQSNPVRTKEELRKEFEKTYIGKEAGGTYYEYFLEQKLIAQSQEPKQRDNIVEGKIAFLKNEFIPESINFETGTWVLKKGQPVLVKQIESDNMCLIEYIEATFWIHINELSCQPDYVTEMLGFIDNSLIKSTKQREVSDDLIYEKAKEYSKDTMQDRVATGQFDGFIAGANWMQSQSNSMKERESVCQHLKEDLVPMPNGWFCCKCNKEI